MTSKNALMAVGAVMLLMGLWSLLVNYASLPEIGVETTVWASLLEVVLGGFGLYVAYSDKK